MNQNNENISRPIYLGFNSNDLPEFVEKKNSEWVLFGKDNLYPNTLIDIFDKSATHSAIVKGKVHYISGNGFNVDQESLNVQETAELQAMLNNANPSESLETVIQKATLDLELFNIIALEVIWKANGKFDLYHIDASKIRVNCDGDLFAYSPDWKKYKKGTEKDIEAGFRTFEKYNPSNPKGRQLYYYVQHSAGKQYYALPEYAGAITYIHADYKIADFHLNYLENGFQAGNLIVFSGQYPGDATAKKIENDLAKKFQGTDSKQAGGVMLVWQQEGEGETKVETLMPSDFDKQFIQLKDQVRNTIFTGHRVVSPNLFGVETDSAFGNRTEIVEKMEIFQSTYVNGRQRILNKIISDLYNTDRVTLDRVDPISEQFSEAGIIQIATALGTSGLEQLAEKAGLEIKKQEEVQMSKQDNKEEDLLLLLSKFGRNADGIKCKYSRELNFTDDKVELNEDAFRMTFEVSDFDKQVLGVLKQSPGLPLEDIAKALNAEFDSVLDSVNRLMNDGLLEANEIDIPDDIPSDTEEIERNPTKEGEEIAEEPDFEIVYRYVKRSGASGNVIIPGSRDFCRRLIDLNRVYTQEEINQMSTIIGHNVWLRSGGFWNDNGTIRPRCRHTWRQELIRK